MKSIDTLCSAGSLSLTDDPNRLLLIGTSSEKGVLIDEIDIADYFDPKVIKSHQFDDKSIKSAYFFAISPGQTRHFIFTVDNDNKRKSVRILRCEGMTLEEIPNGLG